MPANKKPRKKYQPRARLLDPLGYVVEGVKPITAHESYLVDLKLVQHSSLEMLLKGQAKHEHMDNLLAAYNMCEGFRDLIAQKRIPLPIELDKSTLIRGKCALLEVSRRGAKTNHYICRAPEIQALNDLLQLHDELMGIVTVGQMQAVWEYRTSRIVKKQVEVINNTQEETV